MFDFKMAIIKADDFGRGPLIDNWRKFVDVCVEHAFLPSIGIVGSDYSRNAQSRYLARYLSETMSVEFWNHSFRHRDLNQMSPQERVADILLAQKVIEDTTSVRPKVFGAPYNAINANCAADIAQTDEFDTFYFVDSLNESPANIARKHLLTPEIGTQYFRPVEFGYFKRVFDRRSNPSVAVIQVHPAYWTDNCFTEFARVLDMLKQKHYENLGARDLVSYQSARGKDLKAIANAGDALAFVRRVYLSAKVDDTLRTCVSPGDFEYYFEKLKAGTTSTTQFLRRHGIGAAAEPGNNSIVLDIGGGIGNWALAALGVAGNVRAISIDKNKLFVEFMQRQSQDHIDGRIKFALQDAAAMQLGDASVDNIICVNAINYMKIRDVMAEMTRVIKDNRAIIVGAQNELAPILDGFRMLVHKRREVAVERFCRYLRNELRRWGLATSGFISYWNDMEMVALARLSGLQPLLRGIQLPQDYGSLFGEPVLFGYIFIRTSQSAKRAAELAQAADGERRAILEAALGGSGSGAVAAGMTAQRAVEPGMAGAELAAGGASGTISEERLNDIEVNFAELVEKWPAVLPVRRCLVTPWFDAVYDLTRSLQIGDANEAAGALDRLLALGRSAVRVRGLLSGPRAEPAESAGNSVEIGDELRVAEVNSWRQRLMPALLAAGK
ncbi:MAG: methyltransferase domain-containing protein [Rhizobiales bacterium]|nr:methyltransferase domain-containing protein [Hyphomicrobiales bacterium]MBI3672292.1 methyltransferase domain-containing protein [Hyphomicrobiales bacterium]